MIDFTDGCCVTDIIWACSLFIVLITTDGGLASIDTDLNIVVIDNISVIFVSVLYLKLSCCSHQSSNKIIRYSSSFFTPSPMALLPRKVWRSDAYSLTAIMSLCIPSPVFEFLESYFSNLSIDLILSSVSSSSFRILCSSVSKCEFILTRISLIWSWNICRCCRISDIFCCKFFVILSILFLIYVKLCSMLSIYVEVFYVLIISRIDKGSAQ